MRIIKRDSLLGKTINHIEYVREKNWLVLVFDDGFEVMIDTPHHDIQGVEVKQHNLFIRDRHYHDYRLIKNITIKDLGWEGSGYGITYFFIVDTDAFVYRTPCSYFGFGLHGTGRNNLYNFSHYKEKIRKKAEHKNKKENRKNVSPRNYEIL